MSIFTPWLKKDIPRPFLGYLRHYYQLNKNNCATLILFLLRKFNWRENDYVIELPVYGQLCKHVHQGYKIFDLRNGKVTKMFDSDVNEESILNELDRLQNVSEIKFATTLGMRNVNERWYEEAYVSGFPPSSYKSLDSAGLLKTFSLEIIPCLNELILFKQQKLSNISDYLNKVTEVFEISRLSKLGLDMRALKTSEKFVHSLIERLNNESQSDIYLLFSHGDFCPANMLYTQEGLKILDWEGAAYRSALFDFYSYFFYRPACINLPIEKLAVEINEALSLFISKFSSKLSDISDSILSIGNIYRWIFYIEFICKLVSRIITDKNLNIIDFLRRYIDSFNTYEEIVNSDNLSFEIRSNLLN